MDAGSQNIDQMPVIRDLSKFDQRSGNLLERLVFNNRLMVVIICAIVTAVLGFAATKVRINASFEKMIPQSHPYIRNYLDNKDQLRGLGNSLRIVVENTKGDLFDPEYIEILKNINDEVFLTTGVDRAWMKSLWTPATRWTEVTEAGFQGGPVMPDSYDGSPKSIEKLRLNVARAGLVGNIIGDDFRSTAIIVPLLNKDSETGGALDFLKLSSSLDNIRSKYEQPIHPQGNNDLAKNTGKIKIHIAGFAKVVGDLIDGLSWVAFYFAISVVITAIAVYIFTRCLRSTLLAALLKAKRVRKIICSFPRQVDSHVFDALYRAGEIELELVPQGNLAERIRAAGAGIGAFFTPTGYGTLLAEGKETRVIDGKHYVLEYPIHADFALIKAYKGDRWGNLVYRKTARNFGPIMATAAKCTIVQVREIVPLGALDPGVIVTPGIFVQRVVAIDTPGTAAPPQTAA